MANQQPTLPGSGMIGNMNMMVGGNNINMNINSNVSLQQPSVMYQNYPNMHQQQQPSQQQHQPPPQQQQQIQQPPQQQPQPQPQQQQPPDSDPFFKYQNLLPILKESINVSIIIKAFSQCMRLISVLKLHNVDCA